MAVFRVQDNLPDVYVRKSRDFQLLCNIFDIVNGGVKYYTDSIRDVTDTEYCNSRLLDYLQTKLGFITDIKLTDKQQRIILKAFPHITKNKGTIKGILQALNTYLKTQQNAGNVNINIINTTKEAVTFDSSKQKISHIYVIDLMVGTQLLNIDILEEILKFVIPTGYIVETSFYSGVDEITEIATSDMVKLIFVQRSLNDGLRVNVQYDAASRNTEDYMINKVSTVTIPPRHPSSSINIYDISSEEDVKEYFENPTVLPEIQEENT